MRNYKVAFFISVGFGLSLVIQNILTNNVHANGIGYPAVNSVGNSIGNGLNTITTPVAPDFVEASNHAIKSVVHITSKYVSNEVYSVYNPFFGNRYFNHPKENFASGSGVLISEDGYIVTNSHVINNSKEIQVVLNDKRTYIARVIGEDSNSDLALLKIEESQLSFLEFEDSNDLQVGEWVLAVGNPYNLNSTVTAGIISARSRKINILNDGGIESFIQTDAAINPGNSGGALINATGDLIGINTAIQSETGSYTGYGFAIPSNMVEKIVNDLKKFGEVRRAYIGIHITDITSQIQEDLNLNSLRGVLISKVFVNSAAQKAGVENLDVILQINGIEVNSTSELHEIVTQFNPGEEIICTIQRDDVVKEIKLSLQA